MYKRQLDEGPDFTVNGAKDTITLTPAADSDFELIVYDWDKKLSKTTHTPDAYVEVTTSPHNAEAGKTLIVDTTSSRTINLPTGEFGSKINIIDGTGTAGTNNITVASSQKIRASDSDLIIDLDETTIGLVYYNATRGWIIAEK